MEERRVQTMLREEILHAIAKNGRISKKDLSIMLGADEQEVRDCIAKMEEDKIICGYPTVINWDKTDTELVTALIEVKVTPQRGQGFDKIAERIYHFEEVDCVYLMSGGFDLTVIIHGKSMREVAGFVSDKLAPMDSVLSTSTNFVLKKYKEHGLTISGHKTKDERMLYAP